jgi:hypothetical protein
MSIVEELRDFSKLVKETRKAKLSAEEHEKAIELIRNNVLDPSADFTGVLDAMDAIPPLVVGDVVGVVWLEMPEERKTLFLRWSARRDGERNIRRMAFVAASLLAHDPKASFSLLERLLPQDDSAARSQELRQALRVSFLGNGNVKLQQLCSPTLSDGGVVRVCRALLESLEKSVPWTRHNAISQITAEIVSRGNPRGDSGRLTLLSLLEKEVKTWPPEMQRQFADSVRPTAPIVADLFPTLRQSVSSVATEETKGTPASTPITSVLPSSDQNISQIGVQNLLAQLERRTAHFKSELDLFSTLQKVVQQFDHLQSDAKQTDELRARASQLSERLQATEGARAAAFERIVSLEQQVTTTQQQVQQTSADLDNARQERNQLLAQVKAHAEVAIEQFKNRLGANLSRLVSDLPAKQAELSPASGQVLLRQYHQFLDKLEEQGIAVRPRGENQ